MRTIGVVSRIYTDNQSGFTINLLIQFADGYAIFGQRKMLDLKMDIGAWWLKRISDVFEVQDAMSIIGKPVIAEIDDNNKDIVMNIQSIDRKRDFDPDQEVPERMKLVSSR